MLYKTTFETKKVHGLLSFFFCANSSDLEYFEYVHMIPQDVARFYKISQNLNFCWKLQICFQHARRHISHLIRSSRAGYNKFVTVEVLSFVQIWPLAIISSQFDFVLTIEVNKNFCCFTLYLSLLLQKFSKVSLKILLCPASQVYNLFF